MTESESTELQAAIEARLAGLSESFVARYGEDLSDLALTGAEGRFVVRGTVIVPKQLLALQQAFHDWPPEHHRCVGCGGAFDPPVIEVAVLSQQSDDPRHGLLVVDHPQKGPVPLFSRRSGGELVSEWLKGDGPARVLRASGQGPHGRSLVQLADATVGWCDVDENAARPATPQDVPVVRALAPGDRCPVTTEAIERLLREAERAADAEVAYRLGGRDWSLGVDCSAFVQRLVESCTGALLPRHSGDQVKAGRRVPRAELEPADLILARAADRNVLHVALVLPGDRVVHACRIDGRVKVEPIADFLQRYRFLRAQRLFDQKEPPE